MKTKVVILGAAGTGLYMAETVDATADFQFVGFLDDDPAKRDQGYRGCPVLGPLGRWKELPEDHLFLTSLYAPKRTPQFFALVQSLAIPDERWAVIIDPRASVSRRATIGAGSFIGPGCIVEPMVCLASKCALLGNVYFAHDTRLDHYAICANSASLAGGVSIGAATYVGANATIREYTSVGSRVVVGAGSVVVRDIPDGQTVVGNPARPLSMEGLEARS